MKNILVLHGPNLNLLGTREPEVYGATTLDQLNDRLTTLAKGLNLNLTTFQSNAEHELIDRVQQAKLQGTSFIIVNPAAFTHTSIALRDAFLATQIPFIEVHLSNIKSREPFRHHSYLSDIATGVIFGLGVIGYELALQAAAQYLTKN
ncbi:MAG: type II 3-dehydroquinate dehydratase [Proteobacteria bacterium]|nr:type II 3-dehydroquinate dehydratase [Pseudomonadota bacterium]